MISDHNGSDRNNDGADSVQVLNDLMTNNGDHDPFGFSDRPARHLLPTTRTCSARPTRCCTARSARSPARSSATAPPPPCTPADNPAVKGAVYRTGSRPPAPPAPPSSPRPTAPGRVVFWGDSSPIDDGTGQSGNTLYNGWNDPAAPTARSR